MAADPQRQETSSNDLFGRWLAHHEQQSVDQDETTGSSTATTEAPATPRATPRSRRLPSAAIASSALESDPMIGKRILPPSSFGSRRPAANAPSRPGPVNELDREPPPGWEPIVMRSVRTRAEKAEARKVPKPVDRPGRLQRLKARLVDPPAETDEPDETDETIAAETTEAMPVVDLAPLTAPVSTPVTTPVTSEPAARSVEETIRAAVQPAEVPVARHAVPAAHAEPELVAPAEPEDDEVLAPRPVRAFLSATRIAEPEPAPVPEPEPVAFVPDPEPVAFVPDPEPVAFVPDPEPVAFVPDPEPVAFVPESVVARVTEIEPEPIAPQDLPESLSSTEVVEETEPTTGRRSLVRRSLRQLRDERARKEPREPKEPKETREPREPRGAVAVARASTGAAARELVADKARARAATPPKPRPEPAPAPVVVEVAPEPVAPEPLRAAQHVEVATEMPGVYKFTPKRTVRRLLTISMLIGAVGSAYFVRAALEIKDTPSIGLATIAILATAMLWAIRAGASVTKLEVHQGQLEVLQQGGRFVFDLASQYTMIEVQGEPGRPGWKVLFPRRGMAPFRVDASMVDPDDFMRVLRFFRPQLVSR